MGLEFFILKNIAISNIKHFIFDCTVMSSFKKPLNENDFDHYKTINKNYEGIAYTKLYMKIYANIILKQVKLNSQR